MKTIKNIISGRYAHIKRGLITLSFALATSPTFGLDLRLDEELKTNPVPLGGVEAMDSDYIEGKVRWQGKTIYYQCGSMSLGIEALPNRPWTLIGDYRAKFVKLLDSEKDYETREELENTLECRYAFAGVEFISGGSPLLKFVLEMYDREYDVVIARNFAAYIVQPSAPLNSNFSPNESGTMNLINNLNRISNANSSVSLQHYRQGKVFQVGERRPVLVKNPMNSSKFPNYSISQFQYSMFPAINVHKLWNDSCDPNKPSTCSLKYSFISIDSVRHIRNNQGGAISFEEAGTNGNMDPAKWDDAHAILPKYVSQTLSLFKTHLIRINAEGASAIPELTRDLQLNRSMIQTEFKNLGMAIYNGHYHLGDVGYFYNSINALFSEVNRIIEKNNGRDNPESVLEIINQSQTLN